MLRNNTVSRADLGNDRNRILDIHYGDVLIRYGAVVDVSTLEGPSISITDNRFLGDRLTDGDIIMADTAEDTNAGKCVEIEGLMQRNVVAGLHTIPLRPVTLSGRGYWGQYLNSASFRDQLFPKMQGTKVVSLSRTTVVNATVRYPSLPEQHCIGEFFTTLDSLIAAAERQEALLRQKKQAYLQLMFPQEGETQPRLRFNGVSGEWESLQLGKLYEKNTERNGNQFDAGKTLSVSSMTFNAFGNGAAKESLTTYKVLRIGDAAFEGHTSNEFAFGRFVVNTIGDGIMSPRFTAIRPTARWRQSCDLDFWSCYLHDENVMKRILVRSTKRGTMMNELVLDDFFTERIRVPSLPEQRRIGEFFSTLDNLIAAAENRAASLCALKFAYLQRMFV